MFNILFPLISRYFNFIFLLKSTLSRLFELQSSFSRFLKFSIPSKLSILFGLETSGFL